jgi:protein ImuA
MSCATSLSNLHPALWRGNQMLQSPDRCIDTGYPQLSAHLPGRGWPLGCLIDLLTTRAGIGELQLLRPALLAQSARPIVIIRPPYIPQFAAWQAWTDRSFKQEPTTGRPFTGRPSTGRSPNTGNLSSLIWLRPSCDADALWASEQVLRSGAFGAVLLWQDSIRTPLLRRLHLAAQSGDTLFALFRSIAAADQACPAPLRLSLQPARRGLQAVIIKRRGSPMPTPISLPLYADTRFPESNHAIVDSRSSLAPKPGHTVPGLAH